MRDKFLAYAGAFGYYLLHKVLPFDLVVIGLAALSFLQWKGFSLVAFSDRLVWSGLGIAILAGMTMFSEGVGRNFGGPTYTAAQSSTLIDWNIEICQKIVQKLDFRFQMLLIGAITFLFEVLVSVLSPK